MVTGCQAFLSLFLRESRPSRILKKRLARLNRNTPARNNYKIDNPDQIPSFSEFVNSVLLRPTRVFFTELVVFLVTIMASFVFGQIYLLTEALPLIYEQAPLNFSENTASLSFIPVTIGLLLDVLPRVYDHYHLKRIKASGKDIKPEDKIRCFALGAPALAIGLVG